MTFVDSHLHLTAKEFDADRDEVIARAVDSGVRFLVNPAVDLADSRKAVELAEKHASVYACVGVHPHEAAKATENDLRELEELSRHPRVVAIGEIGLDYYYDFAPQDVQQRVYADQIAIAQRCNLPIVVHTRDSIGDTIRITEECIRKDSGWRRRDAQRPAPRGVFHCFSGDLAAAKKVIMMRFYVSFPGIITFKKSELAQTVAAGVAMEDLLLETDSPYLAPVPHRGTRNEPAHIPLIARKLADIRSLPVEDVARTTSYNVYDLFGIGDPEPLNAA
ncbi:MAG: TatD family hydrolase [Ignavibacteria bacterium]|nr:TatD family hydrolase [Ignavibacteria bacterium]